MMAIASVANNKGKIPLHVACKHGNLEIIKLVSSQPGLDINSQDLSGNTPLHIACKSVRRGGDVLPCFRYLLLEKHCSISIQNNVNESPFHVLLKNDSVTEDDIQSIIALCNKEDMHNIINAQNSDGMTILHLACKDSAMSIVHYLTSNFQCDINLLDGKGNLPLHYAVDDYYRDTNVIKLAEMVIDDCTPIHAKNSSDFTPLHIACEHCNVDMAKYLAFHKKHPLTISPASNIYDNLDIHLACQNDNDIDLLKVIANHQNVNQIKYLHFATTGLHYDYSGAPIHFACKYNNIPAIRLLGELKCNFSLKDSQDMLPLHIVCSELRSLECVKLLKIHSNDLKAVDKDGNTPLHLACKHGCADIVKYLTTMSYRCDFKIKNKQKELPLHLACSTTLEVVQRVSRCNVNCPTEIGDTPLHIACRAGALDIVKYLVHNCKCNRSMTMKNESRRLPVHYACEHSLEIVKLVAEPCTVQDLLTKIYSDTYYSDSMTPLDIACSYGLLDVAAYLINDKGCSLSMLQGNQSALGYASGILKPIANDATPYLDLIKLLVDKCGYDPGKPTTLGYSIAPIFECVCRKNNLPLLEALTICSVDTKDSEGDTPLHYACRYSCVEIVQFLVNRGCDQTILNSKGELALHIACCRSLTITQMLTKCDVNTLDLHGNAPIHIACSTHFDDIVTYLIKEAKCDINIPNGSGKYALHIACSRSLRITNLLLQMVDVNCQDADGNTALNIVCSMGLDNMVETLLENDLCRADIPNKSGDFPLHSYLKQLQTDNPELLPSNKLHVKEIILARCSKAATMANKKGITPSQIAVIKGITEFLQLLHQRNELNFANTSNKTLLHIACRYRQVHIVRWLLDHGADSTIPDEDGNYPQHLCIDDNNHELKLKITQEHREAYSWRLYIFRDTEPGDGKKIPEHLYIGADNPSLKTLIELGTLDVYRQNKDGNTILHIIACQDDRDHILQHILAKFEHEKALLLANNNGDTPLHILATRKNDII